MHGRLISIVNATRVRSDSQESKPASLPRNQQSFSYMEPKGPRSLNAKIKARAGQTMAEQNKRIKERISQARSNYSLTAIEGYVNKRDQHRKILESCSTS